jgi:polyketide synthase PksM
LNSQTKMYSDVASMVYAPQWQQTQRIVTSIRTKPGRALFIAPEAQARTLERLREWRPYDRVLALDADSATRLSADVADAGIERIVFVSESLWRDGVDDRAVLAFLRAIKALSEIARLHLTILTSDAIGSPATRAVTHPVDGVYIGFGQTLGKEFPHWQVDCVSTTALSADTLQAVIDTELSAHAGRPVVIDGDVVWTATMAPIELRTSDRGRGFRRGGTYLIVGATGGIGGALARHLSAVYGVQLILVGRRPEADALVAEIGRLGGTAVYEQVDLSDAIAVTKLIERHPRIDGIVHSALALEDASVINMSEASLLAVLRPKVHGAVHLANALRGRDLDFVLMFSSIQSYIANAGQANYTAACVAKDAIAALMRDVFLIDARVVNWGFWGSIGIVASESYRERMRRLEIGSIEAEEGIAIVEQLLRSDVPQITVVKASEAALRRLGIASHPAVPPEASSAVQTATEARLTRIVPTFDPESPAVRRNIAASHALQRYATTRLAQVLLPGVIVEKHRKLGEAIAAMRGGTGPDRQRLLADHPEMTGHARLLEACLEHYPDILSGRIDPLTVMFPEGSFELVEPIYRDNPLADYFNRMVAEVVERFVATQRGRPLRVLEIGAGTGSTAQFVLPVLRDHNATYVFTDLSFAFLNKARRRFDEYPFVRYEIYNVEKPPTSDERFDVVVATNVIHATMNLPDVLRNVRQRISPGGVFVLNEITSLQDYATLTFGLTEGWWLSIDPYRIPNSPLVSGDNWRRLLLDAGFTAVLPHGGEDQQVIVAAVADLAYAPAEPGPEIASIPIAAGRASAAPVSAAPAVPIDAGLMPDAMPAVVATADADAEPVVIAYIRDVIAEVMHADQQDINPEQPFSEYGIDSLIALELLKPFRADLGYLPATVLFEHPTVRRLAKHFIAEFGALVFAAAGRKSPMHAVAKAMMQDSRLEGAPASIAMQQTVEVSRDAVRSGEDDVPNVRHLLRTVIAETMLMDIDAIDADTPFMEYGIDSIISLELLKPLRQKFGYLPATLLFENPTLNRLAQHLAATFPQAAAALPDPSGPATIIERQAVYASPTALAVDGPDASEHRMQDQRWAPRPDDIAIIGMAGRFPDADNIDAFWANLVAHRESAAPVPEQRWPQRGALAANARHYTSIGAFLDDVDAFDHAFFGVTPLEAERMDPQERLFLQTAYHALENAGRPRSDLRGSETGVFVGVMNGGYAWHRPRNVDDPAPTSLFWSIANRTSYLFDLKGPSMAIDTACSSSLTALHLACTALRIGDCDHALIGGVNLIAHPRQYDLLCGMHMLSRDGHCRPFGDQANGFVDGEGVCCLVAKRYADAVRDGDQVLAVVRGTAINAGGQSNGYSAPNPEAQTRAITRAIERAGLRPADIGYVEAHGTGTELGDPIEVRGLCAAFGDVPAQSVALGSLKGNIGHLESAAGLAGVVKVLLQMRYGMLAPSINASSENPHLRLALTPFRLQRELQAWVDVDRRIASVSSYGAGGANAHAVIQAVRALPAAEASPGTYVAALSARSVNALQRKIDALHDWLTTNDPTPAAIAWTLGVGREHFSHRAAFAFDSCERLREALAGDLGDLLAGPRAIPDAVALAQAVDRAGRREHAAAIALSQAYMAGAEIPWQLIYRERQPVALPGYTFDKHRFWVDSAETGFHDRNDIVRQHDINGTCIAPAAWALSHVLESSGASRLTSVLWRDAIRDIHATTVRVDGNRFSLNFADAGRTYCEGDIGGTGPAPASAPANLPGRNAVRIGHDEIYRRFAALGYRYGRDLRPIRWAKIADGVVEASLDVGRHWGYRLSPALIDGGLQTAILLPALQRIAAADEVLLPYHLGAIEVMRIPRGESIYCVCTLAKGAPEGRSVVFDIRFIDEQGQLLVELREMTSLIVKAASLHQLPKMTRRQSAVVHDID